MAGFGNRMDRSAIIVGLRGIQGLLEGTKASLIARDAVRYIEELEEMSAAPVKKARWVEHLESTEGMKYILDPPYMFRGKPISTIVIWPSSRGPHTLEVVAIMGRGQKPRPIFKLFAGTHQEALKKLGNYTIDLLKDED